MENTKILIVEDQKTTAKKIEKDLLMMGYKITSIVRSGEEVIKSIGENKPDLVLMDIILGGEIDGIEAVCQIQASFDIPVVYLTAYADKTVLERAKLTLPSGYLVKPFEAKELRATIETAIFKHRTEKKLKESQKWLSTTLNSIEEGVITINLSGDIIFINNKALSLIKLNPEDAIGKPLDGIFTVVDNQSNARIENHLQKVITEGISIGNNTYVLSNANGRKIAIEYNFLPIKNDKGDIIGIVLVFCDVMKKMLVEKRLKSYQCDLERMVNERTLELEKANTKLNKEIVERKQIEDDMRKLHLAVVQSPAVVTITDTKGIIEYINPKFTEVTGYTFAEVTGRNPRILKSGRHSANEYKQMWDLIASGKEWHGEFYNKKKDGECYWESASISPLRNTEGLITNYVKVAEDITDRKMIETELVKSQCELENRVAERTEELSDANEQIRGSLKEKDVLLQEIHHRVKNNMQLIISLLNMCFKHVKDKEYVEIFEDCVNRVKSIAIIHEHLYKSKDFAKIELGHYIREITDELMMSFGISKNKVKLSTNVNDILLRIDDAIPCGLIINELVSNIFKHAFPGGNLGEISIKIGLIPENELELIFSDNGVGLPEDIDLENIESLGLRLVNGLVTKQLKGKLEMNIKNGTEFRIRFKIR